MTEQMRLHAEHIYSLNYPPDATPPFVDVEIHQDGLHLFCEYSNGVDTHTYVRDGSIITDIS